MHILFNGYHVHLISVCLTCHHPARIQRGWGRSGYTTNRLLSGRSRSACSNEQGSGHSVDLSHALGRLQARLWGWNLSVVLVLGMSYRTRWGAAPGGATGGERLPEAQFFLHRAANPVADLAARPAGPPPLQGRPTCPSPPLETDFVANCIDKTLGIKVVFGVPLLSARWAADPPGGTRRDPIASRRHPVLRRHPALSRHPFRPFLFLELFIGFFMPSPDTEVAATPSRPI